MKTFIILCLSLLTLSVSAQIYLDKTETIEKRVADLLSQMTLEEKIGQMAQVELKSIDQKKTVISKYLMGSVLTAGGSYSDTNTVESFAKWYDSVQFYGNQTPHAIPVLFGIDAVHGHNNVVDAVLFPHNIGLGCTRDTNLVEEVSRITALEMKATGIHWNFAPCVAVARNEKWGRTYEAFSENTDLVTAMGAAAVRGYQGDTLSDEKSVLACAKHFIADGGTDNGTNMGNAIIDEEELRRVHLPPYIRAIEEGVGTVMASFSSWNNVKCHGNKFLLTDVLKNELGFEGFVVSDWGGVDQVSGNYRTALKIAINAGVDMVMLPYKYDRYWNDMIDLVDSSEISMARIDDAVSRILTQKFKMGLFENSERNITLVDSVGTANHRAVAREAVRKSVVLLENNNAALPLKKDATIAVIGKNADDLGYQCGGWSISWQGSSGDITTGTTILEGMQEVAPDANIVYSVDGSNIPEGAIGVVVIGETPYAESNGDSKTIDFSSEDVAAIRAAYNACEKVVCVIVSGRPLILDQIKPYAHAIVAAWLPGTEGQGVADVLFGDYMPSGELSFSWPKSLDQLPINVGDEDYDPLYEYGYGLKNFEDPTIGKKPEIYSSSMSPDGKGIILTTSKDVKGDLSIDDFSSTVDGTDAIIKDVRYLDARTIYIELEKRVVEKFAVSVAYNGNSIMSSDDEVLDSFSTSVYNWLNSAYRISISRTAQAEKSFYNENTHEIQTDDGSIVAMEMSDASSIYFPIKVRKTGNYQAAITYSAKTSADITITVYNANGEDVVTYSLPSGGEGVWLTDTISGLSFEEGETIIKISGSNESFLLDNMLFFQEPSTGISSINTIVVYPNPVENTLHIINSEKIVKVVFTNSLGSICKQVECDFTKIDISLEDLTSGMYHLMIQLENGRVENHKIMVN